MRFLYNSKYRMDKEEKINIYWLNTLYPILLYTTSIIFTNFNCRGGKIGKSEIVKMLFKFLVNLKLWKTRSSLKVNIVNFIICIRIKQHSRWQWILERFQIQGFLYAYVLKLNTDREYFPHSYYFSVLLSILWRPKLQLDAISRIVLGSSLPTEEIKLGG